MLRWAVASLLVLLAAALLVGCGSSNASKRTVALVYTRGVEAEKTTVWIARGDGAGARLLVRGVDPVISPDGRWVAFGKCTSKEKCNDLNLVSASGGKVQHLASDASYGIAWSPDSRHLLTAFGESVETLVVIDVRARKRVVLAKGVFYGFSFSPSGHELVYAKGGRDGDLHSDLYVVSSRGGKERRITWHWRTVQPKWGARSIAFARNSGLRYPPSYRVWRIDPDGRNARLLTRGPIGPNAHRAGWWGWLPADWSADGSRLLAYRTSEFYDRPYAVDPRSGAFRPIGRNGNYLVEALSRDGRLVLLEQDTCFDDIRCARVSALSYDGSRLRVLAPKGWSPDWNR